MSLITHSRFRVVIAISLMVLATPPAIAEEYKGYGDEWQNAIAIYGWGASIGGHTARGTGVDISFSDLLDNLEGGFMASYQGRKGRWSLLSDVLYLDVEGERNFDLIPPVGPGLIETSTDVSLNLKGLVWQLAGGYNLYNRENTTVDFVFGVRYLDLSTDLALTFNLDLPGQGVSQTFPLSKSGDNWDAIIGIKGTIGLGDRWFIPYYADLGGGDSDFTWQASAGIAFKAADWADIALVYRYLAWDIGGNVVEDLDFSGPALGVVFRF